jgi:hypothetical protein
MPTTGSPKNALDGKNAFEAILEQFYAQLAPIAGRKPYMVSPGNHEVACDVSICVFRRIYEPTGVKESHHAVALHLVAARSVF